MTYSDEQRMEATAMRDAFFRDPGDGIFINREKSKYIPERYGLYNKLLDEKDSPIVTSDHSWLHYEPFYQLMRQTLLGWKMVQGREYQCYEFIHLHVIPGANKELRDRVTSPGLRSRGRNMSDAW